MTESTGIFVLYDGTELLGTASTREGLDAPKAVHERRVQEFRMARPFWRVVWNPPGTNPKWTDPVYWERIQKQLEQG